MDQPFRTQMLKLRFSQKCLVASTFFEKVYINIFETHIKYDVYTEILPEEPIDFLTCIHVYFDYVVLCSTCIQQLKTTANIFVKSLYATLFSKK